MYGSYNSTDYGGYSQEIENRHQDYLNRVATTQQRNIAKKTQDLIDAQSIFQKGKAMKTQGSEFLAGDVPVSVGLYKGLKKVRPGIKAAKEYVSNLKSRANSLVKNVSDRQLATVTGKDEEGIEMEANTTEGTEMPSQTSSPSIKKPSVSNELNMADREVDIFEGTGRGGGNPSDYASDKNMYGRIKSKLASTSEQNAIEEKVSDNGGMSSGASNLDAAEDDIGETISKAATGTLEKTTAEEASSGVLEGIVGGAADMLAGPLGVILGGVGLYEGIKEFVDGTKEEASGTKERLSAEAENIRPNIPNPNYSGKFVAPVPKVV